MEVIDVNYLRIGLAFLAGYFLSISGSLTQLITQNELAAPSTLGFDALVVLTILISQVLINQFEIQYPLEWISFFTFSLLFSTFVLILIRKSSSWNKFENSFSNMNKLILMGLGVNLFIGAIFAVVQFLFMSLNFQFPTGLWFGSFRFSDVKILYLFFIVFLGVFSSVRILAKDLRLIAIGKDFALGVGVNIEKVQSYTLIISMLCTGVVISFFGVFSFLGLIFPHILRMFKLFKVNMRNELVYGSLLSGVFLALLDLCCYNFTFYGSELPVGMVSSVLGSLLLIALLVKKSQ